MFSFAADYPLLGALAVGRSVTVLNQLALAWLRRICRARFATVFQYTVHAPQAEYRLSIHN